MVSMSESVLSNLSFISNIQGDTKVCAYFPFDVWYDFYSGYRLIKVGTTLELPAPLHYTNIHVRGGSVIVTQTPARNTSFRYACVCPLMIFISYIPKRTGDRSCKSINSSVFLHSAIYVTLLKHLSLQST